MLFKLEDEYTGKSRKEKLDELKYILGGKSHVINNLESIAYLLNLRGDDILYTPVFYAYMVIDNDDVYLFIDKERLSPEILDELYADGVIIRDYDTYYDFLKKIKQPDWKGEFSGQAVLIYAKKQGKVRTCTRIW